LKGKQMWIFGSLKSSVQTFKANS